MNVKIPNRSFFKFAYPCPYRAKAPKLDGHLGDWGDRYRIPDLSALEGGEPFADFFMSWNEAGLYFAISVEGSGVDVLPKQPLRGDSLQIWIDTRDVREVHRASRYCHHFYFLPSGAGREGRHPIGRQMRIRRARAYGRLCDPQRLGIASRVLKSGYRMEMHLPSEVLTGFDPEENNRLGFSYLLKDGRRGRQHWTADEPLPVSYDPSLWGTVELVR